MPCELPEIKSCRCLPLRCGLIVWGYISFVISLLLLFWKIEKVTNILNEDEYGGSIYYECSYLILMIVDMVLSIVFIFASHMKNVKLLKRTFISNVTLGILFTLGFFCLLCYFSMLLFSLRTVLVAWLFFVSLSWTLFLAASQTYFILIQSYAMFLLHSEIKKLDTDNCRLIFVNNAAEAKCVMECEESNKITNEEKGVEDTINNEVNKGEDKVVDPGVNNGEVELEKGPKVKYKKKRVRWNVKEEESGTKDLKEGRRPSAWSDTHLGNFY